MSITLFEIQRIWDVWPNIRNQQVGIGHSVKVQSTQSVTAFTLQFLRDLFRQLLATSSQDLKISNVFVIPGHIFVAVSPKDGVEPRGKFLLISASFNSVCIPNCTNTGTKNFGSNVFAIL